MKQWARGAQPIALASLLRAAAAPSGDATDAIDVSGGAVVYSQSQNIFVNLAIESALATGTRFRAPAAAAAKSTSPAMPSRVKDVEGQCGPILFVYRDLPCVVIGSNQIPWREANVPLVGAADAELAVASSSDSTVLARRHSGGGTVYHDLGNLCLSFITHRRAHDPSGNMQGLAAFLRDWTGHDLKIGSTDRHDLFVDDRKISGSAMKLTRLAAFHHCTFLVDSDLQSVSSALRSAVPRESFTDSPCIDSVRSPVTRVADFAAERLATAAEGWESPCAAFASDAVDHWMARNNVPKSNMFAIAEADALATAYDDVTARNPKPAAVADTVRSDLDWGWRFGHTLKFTHTSAAFDIEAADCVATVCVVVKRGVIESANVALTSELSAAEGLDALASALEKTLCGLQPRRSSLAGAHADFGGHIEGTDAAGLAPSKAQAGLLWSDFVQSWNAACGWW